MAVLVDELTNTMVDEVPGCLLIVVDIVLIDETSEDVNQ